MPRLSKSRWTRWLTQEPLTSVEQRVVIIFGAMACGGALAAAQGGDVETGVWRHGFGAALLLLIALETYYRRRYRSRRKNGSK
jgi:hypothetical protein